MTLRHYPSLLLALTLLGGATVACNRAADSKEAVREGVMEHLNKNTGLDLKSMDVEVGTVTFAGNQATATVAFKPKSSPDEGMTMNYKLDRQGAKWVVEQKSGGGAGHGAGMPDLAPAAPGSHTPAPPAGESLPPGHPAVPPGSGAKGGDLPPGHPPVSGQATPGQPTQPKTK